METLTEADRDQYRTLAVAAADQAIPQIAVTSEDLAQRLEARYELRERLANLLEKLALFDKIYRDPKTLAWAARMLFLWVLALARERVLNHGVSADEWDEAEVRCEARTIWVATWGRGLHEKAAGWSYV